MTIERLYDTIKTWRDSVTAEGMIATGAEMDNVLKQLEADMLIEQSKKSGTKSIVTAANRIIKNAESIKKPLLAGMFTNQTRDDSTLYCVCDSFVAIRFNENLSCKQVNMLLSELRLHLVGRNVRILPEMPQYFEFVREPVEKTVEDYYNEMNFVNFRDVAVGDCATFKAKED